MDSTEDKTEVAKKIKLANLKKLEEKEFNLNWRAFPSDIKEIIETSIQDDANEEHDIMFYDDLRIEECTSINRFRWNERLDVALEKLMWFPFTVDWNTIINLNDPIEAVKQWFMRQPLPDFNFFPPKSEDSKFEILRWILFTELLQLINHTNNFWLNMVYELAILYQDAKSIYCQLEEQLKQERGVLDYFYVNFFKWQIYIRIQIRKKLYARYMNNKQLKMKFVHKYNYLHYLATITYMNLNDTDIDKYKKFLAEESFVCTAHKKDIYTYSKYEAKLKKGPKFQNLILIKIFPGGRLPMKGHFNDAGFDIYTPIQNKEIYIEKNQDISLRLALHMPSHIWMDLRLRSSMRKYPIQLGGSCVNDARWDKELFANIQNYGAEPITITADRMMQMIFLTTGIGLESEIELEPILKFNPLIREEEGTIFYQNISGAQALNCIKKASHEIEAHNNTKRTDDLRDASNVDCLHGLPIYRCPFEFPGSYSEVPSLPLKKLYVLFHLII